MVSRKTFTLLLKIILCCLLQLLCSELHGKSLKEFAERRVLKLIDSIKREEVIPTKAIFITVTNKGRFRIDEPTYAKSLKETSLLRICAKEEMPANFFLNNDLDDDMELSSLSEIFENAHEYCKSDLAFVRSKKTTSVYIFKNGSFTKVGEKPSISPFTKARELQTLIRSILRYDGVVLAKTKNNYILATITKSVSLETQALVYTNTKLANSLSEQGPASDLSFTLTKTLEAEGPYIVVKSIFGNKEISVGDKVLLE